jgi:hypothetical protein
MIQKIGVPKEAHTFNYFSFSTIKLAFKRVFQKTHDNEEVLIEKEFALAGAKLI